MTLDDILANATEQDRGREFELRHPVTAEPTGIKLWIVGPDSETSRRAHLALADELAEMADADGRVSAEDRERARLNCLARHILRWDIVEDGQKITPSPGMVRRLLRIAWVQRDIDAAAADRSPFAFTAAPARTEERI